MTKEGAVNNKKKLKFCAESKTWIPFTLWKKHKAKLAEVKLDNAVAEASVGWTSVERTSAELELDKVKRELRALQAEHQKLLRESDQLRVTCGHIGKAFSVAFGEY